MASRCSSMVTKAETDASDTTSWVLIGVMALGCLFVLPGEGFVIDRAGVVLPGLGLAALIGAAWIGSARCWPRLRAGAIAFLQMTLFTLLAVSITYGLIAKGFPLMDDRLAAADARLGLDWPALLRVADTAPGLLGLGGIAYQSLIAQMIVCIVALSATRRLGVLRRAIAAAILSGAATVAIAGIVPAMGNLFDPALYHHLPASIAWQERGLLTGLRDGSGRVLDYRSLMGIVSFPSYHATLPVVLAWHLRSVPYLRGAAPAWAIITILATPIFGGHYGVDVLAGLVLSVLAIALASRLTKWRLPKSFRQARPPHAPARSRETGAAVPAVRLAAGGMG